MSTSSGRRCPVNHGKASSGKALSVGLLSGGRLLVDSESLLCRSFIKSLSGRHISAIGITHAHEDHIGNAILQENRRVPVFALRKGSSHPRIARNFPHSYQKLFFGEPSPSSGEPVGTSAERHRFRVIIPQPLAGYVAFYERAGRLFSETPSSGGRTGCSARVRHPAGDEDAGMLSSLGADVMFGMGNVVGISLRQIERKTPTSRRFPRIRRMHREEDERDEIAEAIPGDFPVRLVTSGIFGGKPR